MRTVKKLTALLLCLLMLIGMPFAVSAADTITLDAVVLQEITDTTVTVRMQFSDKIALLNKSKIFLCTNAKTGGCREAAPEDWQFGCRSLTAIAPTTVDGVAYAKGYTAVFNRCSHTYHTVSWDGTLPSPAGVRITEYNETWENRGAEGIATTVAIGLNSEVLATQDAAYALEDADNNAETGTDGKEARRVASHLAWMDATVPDTVQEHVFSVSHVTRMPEHMLKAGDAEAADRTLLVWFNTDPLTAPPDNFRFYIGLNKTADAGSGWAWIRAAKYNDTYVFPNNNPIAVTLMSEEEAAAMEAAVTAGTVTGVNKYGWLGYDGTITEVVDSYGSDYGLRAVLCDSAGASATAVNLNGWYNVYGRELPITTNAGGERQRNNGYVHCSPVEQAGVTLERAVYGDGQTVYAKFSDEVATVGFGSTFTVSMSITNAYNDLMQTKTADTYDGATGTSGTFYGKTATGMEALGNGWYKITFASGDVDTVLGWYNSWWKGSIYRYAKLCIREKSGTGNFFIDAMTASNGLPLTASLKNGQWNSTALSTDMVAVELWEDADFGDTAAEIELEDAACSFMNTDTGRMIAVNGVDEFTIERAGNVIALKSGDQYVDLMGGEPSLSEVKITYLLKACANGRYQLLVNAADAAADSDQGQTNTAVLTRMTAADEDIATGWYLTAAGQTRPLKVMPTGDSITYGVNNVTLADTDLRVSYREELSQTLTGYFGRVVFVGARQSADRAGKVTSTTLSETRLLRHAGYPGYTLDEAWTDSTQPNAIAAAAKAQMAKYKPDIVTLMIGTNDAGVIDRSLSADSTAVLNELQAAWAQDYADFVKELEAAMDGNGLMVCASLTPNANAAWNEKHILPMGQLIKAQVQALADAGEKVAFADQYTAVSAVESPQVDGVHLNPAGNAAMAGEYARVILNNYGSDSGKYTDLQAVLNAAEAGDTVSLTVNEDAGELLVIPANVTLDLHGHKLTATNLNSYGDVKDSTEGTGGICLKGNTTLFTLQSGNSAVPLYDSAEECYRFYTYTFDHKTMDPPENAEKYALRLDLPSAAAYALLDDAANYNMLSVYLVLTDENGVEQETINYTFRQSTMEEYVTKSSVDIAKKYGLTLTVSGLDAVNAAGLNLSASARVTFSVGGVSVDRAYVKGE